MDGRICENWYTPSGSQLVPLRAAPVDALESTKPLAYGCFNSVTNSSKNHCQFCFSWPSKHLFATLGKQMHFGFPFGGRTAGVAATRQGNTYSKCDVPHTDSPTQHTKCMIRTQRKASSTEERATASHTAPELAPMHFFVDSCALRPSLHPSLLPSHPFSTLLSPSLLRFPPLVSLSPSLLLSLALSSHVYIFFSVSVSVKIP